MEIARIGFQVIFPETAESFCILSERPREQLNISLTL